MAVFRSAAGAAIFCCLPAPRECVDRPKESISVYDLVKICVDRAWKNDYNEIEPGVVRFGF